MADTRKGGNLPLFAIAFGGNGSKALSWRGTSSRKDVCCRVSNALISSNDVSSLADRKGSCDLLFEAVAAGVRGGVGRCGRGKGWKGEEVEGKEAGK